MFNNNINNYNIHYNIHNELYASSFNRCVNPNFSSLALLLHRPARDSQQSEYRDGTCQVRRIENKSHPGLILVVMCVCVTIKMVEDNTGHNDIMDITRI